MNKWEPVDRTVPIVGLPADTTSKDGLHFHAVGDKYVRAVAEVADAAPVMIPSLGRLSRLPELLERLDGVVVTGATSNVRPDRYGAPVSVESEPYDEHRDSTTIDLIRLALAMSVPMLAICRGIQELNVALGGTLQSEIQNLPGKLDHRAPESDDVDVRYGPVHTVTCAAGGLLRRIMGTRELVVNSVHRQAIGRLADSCSSRQPRRTARSRRSRSRPQMPSRSASSGIPNTRRSPIRTRSSCSRLSATPPGNAPGPAA